MLCDRCVGINFDASIIYPLTHARVVEESAETGCQGCNFFIELCHRHRMDLGQMSLWTIVLRRLSEKSSRVNMIFVRDFQEGMHISAEQRGAPRLRLCSSVGLEGILSHDIDAEGDALPGRLISAHADYDECLDVAVSWFQRCIRSHGHSCALEMDVPLPTRLIYIPEDRKEPLRLRTTVGQRGQYAALSYVWGNGTTFSSTKATLATRMEGFKLRELPKTVRDAVKITRHMSLQYLWVDALCIIQGDLYDWNYESAHMAEVYGRAAFTISADLARTTDSGILQPRELLRSHVFGQHEELCLQELENTWATLTGHPLYRRGWCLQERVLSSRVLHFFKDQIAWECNTAIYREGFHGRDARADGHFGKNEFTKQFHHKPSSFEEWDVYQQINAWNYMIQEQAVRVYTIPIDRLAGASGIASAISIPELGRYFAGVWEFNPFQSMAWHLRWPQKPVASYRGPSWSWSRSKGQIIWQHEVGTVELLPGAWDEWKVWDAQWGPRLLPDRSILLQGSNSMGNVLEGTYITMRGYTRYVSVKEKPNEPYDDWGHNWGPDKVQQMGAKAHLDWGACNVGLDVKFCTDEERKQTETKGMYLCVLITMEKKPKHTNPKAAALLLEEEKKYEAYRRIGIISFDLRDEDAEKWEKQTLKLV